MSGSLLILGIAALSGVLAVLFFVFQAGRTWEASHPRPRPLREDWLSNHPSAFDF